MAGLSHRQTEILSIARASGRVMVEDLARRFEVSAQTIRKDLNDLCDSRLLTRIHGGAIIANARSVMLVADSTKLRRSAPVRIAHISQIQTFVTDAALPAGLANICHTRGIEVIEAMPKASADIDEAGPELPSTVTRLR